MKCGDNLWSLLSNVPSAIAIAAVLSLLIDSRMFPGGAVRYIVGILVLVGIVKVLKICASRLSQEAEWSMRPYIAGMSRQPGFPSSHAASMGFTLVFLAVSQFRNAKQSSHTRSGILVAIVAIATVMVCYSRVIQMCHTDLQVVCGVLVGLVYGLPYAFTAPRMGAAL